MNIIKKYIQDKRLHLILICTIAFGTIIHGQMMFNKLMYHDEAASLSGRLASITVGRWATFFINRIIPYFFDSTSTTTFSVLLSIIFLGIANYLIVELLKITDKFHICLLSLVGITNLYVCCSIGYNAYTAYFSFSILLGILSAYIFIKYYNIIGLLFASILLSISIGIYQSNIVLYICIILVYFIINIQDFKITTIIKSIIPCLFSITIYLIMYKSYCYIKNYVPSSYKNIDTLGVTDIYSYLLRIKYAFINFFIPENMKNYTMYPGKSKFYYIVFIILLYINLIYYAKSKYNKNLKKNFILLIFMILLIPFVFNGMFIIGGAINVYAMNLYNYILIFYVFFAMYKFNFNNAILKKINYISIGLIIIIILSLIKYTDACYNNLYLKVEQEKSYGLTLISRIENLPEYSDEMMMCFVENVDPYHHRYDDNFEKDVTYNDFISTPPYGGLDDGETYVYNSTTDYHFNKIINGFNPKLIEYKKFGHNDEIKAMPVYPKAGSIKIIDNVVVIKMQEVSNE